MKNLLLSRAGASLLAVFGAFFLADSHADNPPAGGYLDGVNVAWTTLLAPPPAPGSAEQKQDEAAVIAMQRKFSASSARGKQAIGDVEVSCFRFADVLGDAFAADKLPLTKAVLDKMLKSGRAAIGDTKHQWMRPRPYVINKKVRALGDADPAQRAARSAEVQREIDYTSYPSGHATFGTLCGIVLAQLVPEKRNELFARANVYRESRMIIGVHFRTDIEAGRALGTTLGALLQLSPTYQQDMAAAAKELRTALGLPADPAINH